MRKKPVNTSFVIDLVVYPFHVLVSVGQTDHQVGKALDRLGVSSTLTVEDIEMCRYTSDRAQGRACMFSTNQSFLRIRKLPETSEEYGVLAHEIFHIVTFVMDRIGMKLDIMVSDEAYAYLTGYLTTQIYEKLNKYY